jgi:hypothetical protein
MLGQCFQQLEAIEQILTDTLCDYGIIYGVAIRSLLPACGPSMPNSRLISTV